MHSTRKTHSALNQFKLCVESMQIGPKSILFLERARGMQQHRSQALWQLMPEIKRSHASPARKKEKDLAEMRGANAPAAHC